MADPIVVWNEAPPRPEIFHTEAEHVFRRVLVSPNLLDRKNPDTEKKIPYLVCDECGHSRRA